MYALSELNSWKIWIVAKNMPMATWPSKTGSPTTGVYKSCWGSRLHLTKCVYNALGRIFFLLIASCSNPNQMDGGWVLVQVDIVIV